jgi:hypothetical protein
VKPQIALLLLIVTTGTVAYLAEIAQTGRIGVSTKKQETLYSRRHHPSIVKFFPSSEEQPYRRRQLTLTTRLLLAFSALYSVSTVVPNFISWTSKAESPREAIMRRMHGVAGLCANSTIRLNEAATACSLRATPQAGAGRPRPIGCRAHRCCKYSAGSLDVFVQSERTNRRSNRVRRTS